jgi:hypothetical protein
MAENQEADRINETGDGKQDRRERQIVEFAVPHRACPDGPVLATLALHEGRASATIGVTAALRSKALTAHRANRVAAFLSRGLAEMSALSI